MSRHTFCHVEWMVKDLEKAKKFYGSIFNWKFEGWGDSYLMIQTSDENLGGGLMKGDEVVAGTSPTVYISVEEVDKYLQKAVAAGAKVCVPKTEIPGMGHFGIFNDPDGNAVGIYESNNKEIGEANHAFCHFEWAVRDAEKAKAFFGGLFEWQFETFGGNYHMFRTPNEQIGGGLMVEETLTPAQSPTVYVMVDQIEPYLEKAATVGGQVAMGKTEIPGMGWFAVLLDPDKNAVGIYETARKG